MAWAYTGTLQTDFTQCGSSNSLNFPVLVSITDTTLKLVAHGGQINNTVTQSGGNAVTMPADLIFTSDSAGSTKIPWEFESYDGTAGTIIAWVQVATLSHTANTIFYVFYGDASVTTQQNTGSYAPSAVWAASQKMVLHAPNGTSLLLSDSTGNTTQTNHGATAATGKIDGGVAFTGGQYVSMATLVSTGTRTLEFWIKFSSVSGYQVPVSLAGNGSGVDGLYVLMDGTTMNAATGGAADKKATTTFATGTWYHVVLQKTTSALNAIYVNGVNVTTSPGTNFVSILNTNYLGVASDGTDFPLSGVLDEIKLYSITISADWITAEYNNQKSASTFLSVTLAPVVPPAPPAPATKSTASLVIPPSTTTAPTQGTLPLIQESDLKGNCQRLNRNFTVLEGDINSLQGQVAALTPTASTGLTGTVVKNGQVIYGTHSQRTQNTSPSVSLASLFVETDRGNVVYEAQNVTPNSAQWVFVAGVYGAAAAKEPTDLGVNDTGFLFFATDTLKLLRWSGTAWVNSVQVVGTPTKATTTTPWYGTPTGTRALATVYQNLTGLPLYVTVTVGEASPALGTYVLNCALGPTNTPPTVEAPQITVVLNASFRLVGHLVVPNNYYYEFATTAGVSLAYWLEEM